MQRFMGLVLAGGRSSRMGEDKALLELWGVSFLQKCVELLSPYCEKVWVSGDYSGFDSIRDPEPFQGPLAGVNAALQQLSDAEGVIVLPVDMPLLPQAALEQLLQQAQVNPQQAVAFNGSLFPLYLPIAPEVQECAQDLLLSELKKDRSIKALLERLQASYLEYSKPEQLININTPEQFLACQQVSND